MSILTKVDKYKTSLSTCFLLFLFFFTDLFLFFCSIPVIPHPKLIIAKMCIYVFFFFLQTWTPHYFVLTSHKIYYSEETSRYQTTDEEEEDEGKTVGMTADLESHELFQ